MTDHSTARDAQRRLDEVQATLVGPGRDARRRKRAMKEFESALNDLVDTLVTAPGARDAAKVRNLIATACRIAATHAAAVSSHSEPWPRDVVDCWRMFETMETAASVLPPEERGPLQQAVEVLRPLSGEPLRKALRSAGVPPEKIDEVLDLLR